MRKGIWLLLVALPVCLFAQNKNAEESKLLAMENAWNIAQKEHDARALDALVGDRFINTDWDGRASGKAQFLADAKDISYKFDSVGNMRCESAQYDHCFSTSTWQAVDPTKPARHE